MCRFRPMLMIFLIFYNQLTNLGLINDDFPFHQTQNSKTSSAEPSKAQTSKKQTSSAKPDKAQINACNQNCNQARLNQNQEQKPKPTPSKFDPPPLRTYKTIDQTDPNY